MNLRNNINGAELADRIGVSRSCIYRWEKQGKIKPSYISPGGTRMYSPEDVIKVEALFLNMDSLTIGLSKVDLPNDGEERIAKLKAKLEKYADKVKSDPIMLEPGKVFYLDKFECAPHPLQEVLTRIAVALERLA